MHDINFLRDRRKKLSKTQKQDKSMMRNAQFLFAGIVLVLVVVLGLRLFFAQRMRSLQDGQDRARQQILDNEQIERTFVITVNKLDILNTLFKERQNKQEAINFFSTVFGPQVLVKQIEFNAGESILTFGLSSEDVFVLESVLQRIDGLEEEQPQFAKVVPSNLRRTSEGSYEMQVTVTLVADKDIQTGEEAE